MKNKSKGHSKKKQLKKELESKLVVAFETAINQFGHAKKSKKTVEKFARLIAKKLSPTNNETTLEEVAPVVKKEEPVKAEKTKTVTPPKEKLVAKAKPIK
jgi:hypothetical protein